MSSTVDNCFPPKGCVAQEITWHRDPFLRFVVLCFPSNRFDQTFCVKLITYPLAIPQQAPARRALTSDCAAVHVVSERR